MKYNVTTATSGSIILAVAVVGAFDPPGGGK
jgi:hypothetical protein